MSQASTLYERLRSWLPLIPPLLLLAGTYWLNQQVQPLPPQADDSKRHDIDYSVENLSSVTLNERGQARYMMTTEKMWHYPDDNSTHLQLPRFVSLRNNEAPLLVWAQTGTISSHGDDIYLYDEVKVMRLDNTEKDEKVFDTDYLHIIPDKDQVETDHPVTMTSARDTIHGVGMTLDNKLRYISFLSDVHATHDTVSR